MKKIIAVVAIVIAAIAIAVTYFTLNNSVIPTPKTNTMASPIPVTIQTPTTAPTQGKHHDISLSDGIGVKESP